MVMRPKSIATVVSALRDLVASVMSFSVDSTVISLMVRIRVVLPAANGPVTTIFTACALPPLRPRLMLMSQTPDAGNETQQQALVHAGIALDVRLRLRFADRRCGHRTGTSARRTVRLLRKVGPAPRHERFGPGWCDRRAAVGNEAGGRRFAAAVRCSRLARGCWCARERRAFDSGSGRENRGNGRVRADLAEQDTGEDRFVGRCILATRRLIVSRG